MYRKIVWCYMIVLTLLDISLNTKLTAQGKSHGAGLSVHDSLVEGITFSEWGKEAAGQAGEAGGGGARAPLRLEPAALAFGARPLGAAHAATVTLTNTANTTLHLASVAGTTPDFHASFFDSKTLPPDGNTTFSVVYLGRREGLVSAHLYIHTALGVHKYPVSAEGVASEWGVWPLLGLRVPANASLQPVLTLRNPTHQPVQVSEVYSSGGWVRLALPAGGGAAARGAWLVPPHAERDIVRLLIAPPHHTHIATAYVRIKANMTGGGLIVGVEARGAPPGEFADPPQLRLRARGDRDPPGTFSIWVGSSAGAGGRLEAAVTGARCLPAPAPDPPHPPHPAADTDHAPDNKHTHNGVKSEGAHVSLVRADLEPHQPLTRAAHLTLHYDKLWAGYVNGGSEADNGAAANGANGDRKGSGGAWCSGVVRLGRAALPYSLRLLPGTLALQPDHIDVVTADEAAPRALELAATNEFRAPLALTHLEVPPELAEHLVISGWSARVLGAGQRARLLALRLRERDGARAADSALTIHTNVSNYVVPVKIYSGKLDLEWEWPTWSGGALELGALGTSATRRVRGLLRNPAPRALCVTAARATLPGASLALDHAPPARCIPAGGSLGVVLTLVAPARAGELRGAVAVSTPHASTEHAVTLSAHAGRLAAPAVRLGDAAPYAWAEAPLVVESTMSLRMRVVGAWGDAAQDPALHYAPPPAPRELAPGRAVAGLLSYRPEKLCEPRCYTGLDTTTPEGMSWLSDGERWLAAEEGGAREAARRADRALLAARRALYRQATTNITMQLRTTQVVAVPVSGWVRLRWPRLAARGAGWAGLAGVGGAARHSLAVRNPSRSHALLLQPALGPPPDHPPPDEWEGSEAGPCAREQCEYAADAFRLAGWRVRSGHAAPWPAGQRGGEHSREESESESGSAQPAESEPQPGAGGRRALGMLLLSPGAQIELQLSFSPQQARAQSAYLYLRNNLTIVEGVQLAGRGAFPSFELGGRRPGAAAPLVFEVTECGGAGVVRRTLLARNTGAVRVRLREWRVAGALCADRGFALQPCAPLTLQPNESVPLTLSYTPDWTLSRAGAALELLTERGTLAFQLAALTAPRLLARCARTAPRPPAEPAARAAAALLALAALVLVLAAAALDAERLLRRARQARAATEPRAPLDLRAVTAPPAPPPAPPRAVPPRRRKTRKVDPQAESRAFERWRASLRRNDDEDSRSSEDADHDDRARPAARAHSPAPAPPAYPRSDSPSPAYEHEPSEQQPAGASSGSDDAHSSGSESSEPSPVARPAPPAFPPAEPPADPLLRPEPPAAPADPARCTRRREPEARRCERRAEPDGQRARAAGKHHTRKDKPSKRRERAVVTPPRSSPPAAEARGAGGAGGGAAGGVRWGASWSSVVARSAAPPSPPAPPGPPAAPRASHDHSLFYFNGEPAALRPEPQYAWRAPPEPAFHTPTTDFLDEPVGVGVGNVSSVGGVGSVGGVSGVGGMGGNSYGSIGHVWGSSLEARAPGSTWPWPSYNNTPTGAVRPPPGFGSSPPSGVGAVGSSPVGGVGGVGAIGTPAGGARVVRPFDPFHSLADIWSHSALDWRADDHDDR